MEVLYNSQINTDTVTCWRCNSILKIHPYDLFEKNTSLFTSVPAVKCPVCGKIMIYCGSLIPWYER